MSGLMSRDDINRALEEHVRRNFPEREIDACEWRDPPARDASQEFRALKIAPPGDVTGLWNYASVSGCVPGQDQIGTLQFIITTRFDTPRAVDLLARTANYNRNGRLGMWDTVPVGEPWLPGSSCDHLLLHPPGQFDPNFKICHVGDRLIEYAWLLPITTAERDFRAANGPGALRDKFEEVPPPYWDARRPSSV